MKDIIILKMGDTLDSVKRDWGDFENHVKSKLNTDENNIKIIDCKKDRLDIEKENIKGIIITGSHSMVTDYEPWSVRVSDWLKTLKDTNIPILGICYGHQLLADALGGEVDFNPKGEELGTTDIKLTNEGLEDELLKVLPRKFKGHVAHSQTVMKIPMDSKLLAYNTFSDVQAFCYKNHIWGVQFHPEFCADIVKKYIDNESEKFIKNNLDITKMYNSVEENNYGQMIFDRFIEISNNRNK